MYKNVMHKLVAGCCRPETRLWSPLVTEGDKPNPFKVNLESEPQVSVAL